MDLIPFINNREYAVFDSNFVVVLLSSNIQPYVDQVIAIGEDIRTGFPELVGLESVCQDILSGQEQGFTLETVSRQIANQANKIIYFNLYLQSSQEYIAIWLEDVTELVLLRQSSMQKLNEAEVTINKLQRFEYCTNKIIASMRDVLLITTPKGIIERVNKSTTELFRQKKSQLLNQSIDNLIQDPNFNHQQVYNFLLSAKDSVSKIEVNLYNIDQQLIQIEFDCFIAPTEVTDFYQCVYIGRDITARKKAEAEIRKSLAREKELRQLKSGFISMASHEFRNPLSSILLCIQNLMESDNLTGDERQFYLQSIQDAALTINCLLEDILTISKVESGQQKLKLEPLDLQVFSSQIIQELTAIYAQRTINFDYQVAINTLNLDIKNLRHILSNLLSNALKYSAANQEVELKISYIDSSQELIIEVRDRGIGIPEASQKHIFESFYRANNVDNIPGTGLGLSIVKKAVELYKGSIVINSKANQGTSVKVTLPITVSI
ncbi:two-component hybrid sensor and regulator [Chondrocystis sp. NIES-4102]|nr:two-component hybrid sensor and regulator [Chondrocystis sp. NIES-4102]